MGKNLLSTYDDMVKLAGLTVNSDGTVSIVMPHSGNRPALMSLKGENKKKRLVLPTQEQLKAEGGWDNRVAFHPLKENVLGGETMVLYYLRKKAIAKLNLTFNLAIELIFHYITENKAITELSKEARELVTLPININDLTTSDIGKYLSSAYKQYISLIKHLKESKSTTLEKDFVDIYLKKQAKIDNTTYNCAAVVSFPFYNSLVDYINALENEEEDKIKIKNTYAIYGFTGIRKNDPKVFKAILDNIIPKEHVITDDKGHISIQLGIGKSQAPFTECLIKTICLLGDRFNKIFDLLDMVHVEPEDKEKLIEYVYFDTSVVEAFEEKNMESLMKEIMLIPALPGNEGSEPKSPTTNSKTTPKSVTDIINSVKKVPAPTNRFETITETVVNNISPQLNTNQSNNIQPQAITPVNPIQQGVPRSTVNINELLNRQNNSNIPPWANQQGLNPFIQSNNGMITIKPAQLTPAINVPSSSVGTPLFTFKNNK